MSPEGGIRFTLEEVLVIIEDLMRVAHDLRRHGDEVNAFVVDQIANQLLDRAFGNGG